MAIPGECHECIGYDQEDDGDDTFHCKRFKIKVRENYLTSASLAPDLSGFELKKKIGFDFQGVAVEKL
jgi:hypothetical protein